jgi:hypothetical protein
MTMRIGKIIGVWALIATLVAGNGVLAFAVFIPFLGRAAGEMMGFFIGMTIILAVSRRFLADEPEVSRLEAIRISLLWMTLTAGLEVGVGRLAEVAGVTPQYGMLDGSFWPLIVLCAGIAPIQWLRHSSAPITVTK